MIKSLKINCNQDPVRELISFLVNAIESSFTNVFMLCKCNNYSHQLLNHQKQGLILEQYIYCLYRVSRKTVHTFVSLISRLPRGLDLDIPSWTFFNCPFGVEFKTIHFFIIR